MQETSPSADIVVTERRSAGARGMESIRHEVWKPCWQEIYRVEMFGAELELRTWRRVEVDYGHGSSGVHGLCFRK